MGAQQLRHWQGSRMVCNRRRRWKTTTNLPVSLASPSINGIENSQVRVTISITPVASSTSATVSTKKFTDMMASQTSISTSTISSPSSIATMTHASSVMSIASGMATATLGTMMEMQTAPTATAEPAAAQASGTGRHKGDHRRDHKGFVIKVVGVIIGVFVGLMVLSVVLFILYRRYGRRKTSHTSKV